MTRTMRPLILTTVVCLLGLAGRAPAQIVNTLGGWQEDEMGWSGSLGALANVTGGNTDVVTVGLDGQIQWQNERDRLRVLGGAKLQESVGVRVQEWTLVHARYNRRFTSWLSSISFVQYQRNPFQRLEARALWGAGARLDVIRGEIWRVSLGVTPMLEREEIVDDPDAGVTQVRLSQFLALTGRFGEQAMIELMGFTQPLLEDPEDIRNVYTLLFRNRIVDSLAMVMRGNVSHDNRPPPGVREEDWSFESGLALSF